MLNITRDTGEFLAVLVRATRSRDIRAGNMTELFTNQAATPFVPIDRVLNVPSPLTAISSVAGGNPNLDPETSRTYTFGFVFQPSAAPGFSTSVDYRLGELRRLLKRFGGGEVMDGEAAVALWREVRDVRALVEPRDFFDIEPIDCWRRRRGGDRVQHAHPDDRARGDRRELQRERRQAPAGVGSSHRRSVGFAPLPDRPQRNPCLPSTTASSPSVSCCRPCSRGRRNCHTWE